MKIQLPWTNRAKQTGLSVPSCYVDPMEILGGNVSGVGQRRPKGRDWMVNQITIENNGKRYLIRGENIEVVEFYI